MTAQEAARHSRVTPQRGPLNWRRVDPKGLLAKDHVRRHNADMPGRVGPHSVFNRNGINQTAKAWEIIKTENIPGKVGHNGNWEYVVPMENAGWQGGNASLPGHGQPLNFIKIITQPNSNNIVTSYPVAGP